MAHKVMKELIAVAIAEGARLIEAQHRGHTHIMMLFEGPAGRFRVLAPNSPSDIRYRLNFRSDVRRGMRGAT
jgi:hypothetical protein